MDSSLQPGAGHTRFALDRSVPWFRHTHAPSPLVFTLSLLSLSHSSPSPFAGLLTRRPRGQAQLAPTIRLVYHKMHSLRIHWASPTCVPGLGDLPFRIRRRQIGLNRIGDIRLHESPLHRPPPATFDNTMAQYRLESTVHAFSANPPRENTVVGSCPEQEKASGSD